MSYNKNHDLLVTLGVIEPFYRNFHADPLNKGLDIEIYLALTKSPDLIGSAFDWAERENLRLQRYL